MGIQKWSDNLILVSLAEEPTMGEELRTVHDICAKNGNSDVVIDFAEVDIVTSSSIAKLLKLRKLLKDTNRKLVLCSLKHSTRSILAVTGLENVFEVVDDKFLALAGLQLAIN